MFQNINKTNKSYVKQVQEMVGVTPDGVAGPNTLKALREYYGCEVITHMGKFVPLHNTKNYIVEHDLSLYERADGNQEWYRRRGPVQTICLHWGGLNARHLWCVFHNCKGDHKSTHFGIGRDPKDNNRIEVQQYLDTALVSYHGGKFNKYSVGIDICQHPDPRYLEKSKSMGYDTHVIQNHGSRGPDEMLSIDPELAEVAKAFLEDLRVAMELDNKPICKHENVIGIDEAATYSIVSHLNISKAKWDIALPWAEKLHHAIDDSESNV